MARPLPMALATAALVAALAAPASARPLPVVIDAGPGLQVRAEAGMEPLAREVATLAPAALERVYADLVGLAQPAQIEIRLVRASEDLREVAPDGARVPPWAVGVAFPAAGVIAVAARRAHEPIAVAATVTHELAHLALGAALGGRAPRWLDEGFAYLHSSELSLARTTTLTGMAWSGERYFFYELEDRFPAREDLADRAYAQSYDFVAFLARRGRWSDADDDGDRVPFRRLLAAIAAGQDLRVAGRDAYGVTLPELEDEWWAGLRERYMWSLLGLSSVFVWVAGALLVVVGWWRRRRQNRRRLAVWAVEEARAPVGGVNAPTPLATAAPLGGPRDPAER
jgi:hypothetical protein